MVIKNKSNIKLFDFLVSNNLFDAREFLLYLSSFFPLKECIVMRTEKCIKFVWNNEKVNITIELYDAFYWWFFRDKNTDVVLSGKEKKSVCSSDLLRKLYLYFSDCI